MIKKIEQYKKKNSIKTSKNNEILNSMYGVKEFKMLELKEDISNTKSIIVNNNIINKINKTKYSLLNELKYLMKKGKIKKYFVQNFMIWEEE